MPDTIKDIEIDDRVSYSTTRLKRMGIGDGKLKEMRSTGIVKARDDKGCLVYIGEEINQFYRQLPVKEL
jgi:hypothetical protein